MFFYFYEEQFKMARKHCLNILAKEATYEEALRDSKKRPYCLFNDQEEKILVYGITMLIKRELRSENAPPIFYFF